MWVTSIYAAVFSLIFVFLSFRVIGIRRQAKIALGDGGNSVLLRRQRVHANYAEYVPLTLILMVLMELQKQPEVMLHAVGLALLAGRLIHAAGVAREPEDFKLRTTGMVFTFIALITGAVSNLGLGGVLSMAVGVT